MSQNLHWLIVQGGNQSQLKSDNVASFEDEGLYGRVEDEGVGLCLLLLGLGGSQLHQVAEGGCTQVSPRQGLGNLHTSSLLFQYPIR